VPGLSRLGFPYADVRADGSAVLSKLPSAGGRLDRATCLEQLLYEVEDPARYLTPDVVVDFRSVRLEEVGRDAVGVSGARGMPPPETLKVSVGVDGGFVGSAAISYAGPGCLGRARLAAEVVLDRWREKRSRPALGYPLQINSACIQAMAKLYQNGAQPGERITREIVDMLPGGPAIRRIA
jgi:hypothetical protein